MFRRRALRPGNVEQLLSLAHVESGGRAAIAPQSDNRKAVVGDPLGFAADLQFEVLLE